MIEVGFFRNYAKSWIRHVIITVALIGVATAVSMATDCLGLVIEIAVQSFFYPSCFGLPLKFRYRNFFIFNAQGD